MRGRRRSPDPISVFTRGGRRECGSQAPDEVTRGFLGFASQFLCR
ncbi:hypothetical protein BRADI_2g35317v3 [Brachypodium distachyon]|uniref:Uncharacterized protein n=1 Tax=Brachypodium distachyon TaxID=15368 RepID=A0A2K2DBW9_BRADI|nr:hypothetical protein BRADI_2g35317v3 [Brachypodium distachyon]